MHAAAIFLMDAAVQCEAKKKNCTTLYTNIFFLKSKSYVGDLLRQNTVILQLLFLCKAHLKLSLRFLMQKFISMGTITVVDWKDAQPSHGACVGRYRFSGCYLLPSLHFFCKEKSAHTDFPLTISDTVSSKH